MIKVTRRLAAAGAGALAVVALGAGTTLLTALPGGPAFAAEGVPADDDQAQVVRDCDKPHQVQDGYIATPWSGGANPQYVQNVVCETEITDDLGHVWGPHDKVWADGKQKEVPACRGKASVTKSQAHTTGTNFTVGVQIGVDKELPEKIKPQIQARLAWTKVDVNTTTYGQSFEVPEFSVGWYDVRSSLHKFKANIHAKYYNDKEFDLKDVELNVPDPTIDDAWVGQSRPMSDEEKADLCAGEEPAPAPTDEPTGEPTEPPAEPPAGSPTEGAKSLVNVANGNVADVAGHPELHAAANGGGDGQTFNIKPQDDGRVILEPATNPGWALGRNTDATKLDQGIQPFAIVSPDGEGADQRWTIVGAGGDAYNIKDENGECLTAPGDQDGTIGVFGCTGGDLQRWRLENP